MYFTGRYTLCRVPLVLLLVFIHSNVNASMNEKGRTIFCLREKNADHVLFVR